MSPSRPARHLRTLALTAFVVTGVLASLGRPGAAAQVEVPEAPPSLWAGEGYFEEKPLESPVVTAAASFTVSILPEKVRLRFGARAVCPDGTADVEAARPPATRAPAAHPAQEGLPALRLAERAGRCAAPSTAPPSPTT